MPDGSIQRVQANETLLKGWAAGPLTPAQQAAEDALLTKAVALGLLWQESLLGGTGSATIGGRSLPRLFADWKLPVEPPEGLDLSALRRDAFAPGESVHLLGLDAGAEGRGDVLFRGERT